ncbi:MAG TPA: AI-2E family transporter [bacterium]
MGWFSREFLFQNARFVLLLLLLLLMLGAVYFFHEVMLPFALAIFLAYLLAPVIDWLSALRIRSWNLPRGLAVLAVYALMLSLIAVSGAYLFPRLYSELNRLVRTLPDTLHQLEDTFARPVEGVLNRWISGFLAPSEPDSFGEQLETTPPSKPPGTVTQAGNVPAATPREPWQVLVEDYTFVVRHIDDTRFEIVPQKRRPVEATDPRQPFQFERQLSAALRQMRESLEQNLLELLVLGRRVVRVLLNSVFTLFLVLMISGFVLIDPGRIHGFARSLVPTLYQDAFDDWLHRLDHGLSGVVRGQAIICVVNGLLTAIGIAVLGVPFVVTLSVLASLFSLIPIFGVLISSIPILIMALTVSVSTALLALAWILAIHFLEGNFLNPKILGDSAKIHPALIVFALLVGEHFAGVIGALLAVPIFSLIQNSFLFLKHKAESLESAQ